MEKKIEFAPNVMLIDASYLDRVVRDMANHFSPIINRELPKADLASLLECLALDSGVVLGDNAVQVIFIYDSAEPRMSFCTPSDLDNQLGEFSIYSFQPSDMATCEELFNEALMLAGESKDVKRVIAVADEDAYQQKTHSTLNKIKGKDSITLFGMNPPKDEAVYSFEMLGFAVLQSLGIKAEEL